MIDLQNQFLKDDLPKLQLVIVLKLVLKLLKETKSVFNFMKELLSQKKYFINTTITVRKVLTRYWIERVFLVHSPKVDSIKVYVHQKFVDQNYII